MSQGTLFYYYAVGALSVLFVLVVLLFFQNRTKLVGTKYIVAALCIWPFTMLDEWAKTLELDMFAMTLGSFEFAAVIVVTLVMRAIKPVLQQNPTSSFVLWLPAIVCGLSEIPLLFVDVNTKLSWFALSQVGSPLTNWPFYLPPLLSAFGVLLLGVLLAEDVHKYHFYLPSQAVDIKAYKVKRIGGVSGITVGIAFTSILLLCAATFGFFSIPFWQSLFHLLMSAVTLALIMCLVYPQRTSPSPLDYKLLQESDASSQTLQATLDRAKLDMIELKAYKQRELTMSEFCQNSNIDPNLLAQAFQLEKYKTFRGFVYHYRLEYAKKILLRSDASIARVAKRLGLESEKFLSGVLPDYLNER